MSIHISYISFQLASAQQAESQEPQAELEDPINAQPGTASDLEGQYLAATSMPELSTATQPQGQMPPPDPNQFFDTPGKSAPLGYSLFPQRGDFTSAGHAPFTSLGYKSVTESDQLSHLSGPVPPPPPPLFMAHPAYAGVQSPHYQSRPVCQPGWYSHPSPMSYPHPYSPYHLPYSSPYPVHSHRSTAAASDGTLHGYYQPQSYYRPSTCSPQVNLSASQKNQATSYSQGYPLTLTPSKFPEGLRPPILPFSLHSMGTQCKAGDSALNSPSGVTAASIQVEAPTTPPPSAPPSDHMQPSSSNINSNNSNADQFLPVPGVAPSTTSITQVQSERFNPPDVSTDKSASLGFNSSASAPSLLPPRQSYNELSTMFFKQEGKSAGIARQENAKTKFEKDTEDEQSISSLPLSAPGDYQA